MKYLKIFSIITSAVVFFLISTSATSAYGECQAAHNTTRASQGTEANFLSAVSISSDQLVNIYNSAAGQSPPQNIKFGIYSERGFGTTPSGSYLNITNAISRQAKNTGLPRYVNQTFTFPASFLDSSVEMVVFACKGVDFNSQNPSADLCEEFCTITINFTGQEPVNPDPEFPVPKPFSLCEQINDPAARDKCDLCSKSSGQGVWTGVGCFPTSLSGLTSGIVNLAIGMAGGLGLVFMLLGAFTMSTSASNPERLKTGQEMFVSAIAGLMFIILSIVLLQFIGVEILQLPGFGV